MAKILFSTGSLYKEPIEKSFYIARRAGFDGVEVVMNDIYYRKDIEDFLGSLSVVCPIMSFHAPFFVEGSSRKKILALKRTIEIAKSMNVKTVVFHPPMKPIFEFSFWLWFKKARFENEEINLCIENMPFISIGRKIFSLFSYAKCDKLKEVAFKKGLKIAFDTTHWGTLKEKNIIEGFLKCGGEKLIKHIHLSDALIESGTVKEHIMPGRGSLYMDEFLSFLGHINYNDTITIEIMPDQLPESDIERVIVLKELIKKIKDSITKGEKGYG